MGNTFKGDIAMSNINKKQDWATNADWWENAFCNGSISYHYKRMEWYKCPGLYVRTSEEARLVNLLKAELEAKSGMAFVCIGICFNRRWFNCHALMFCIANSRISGHSGCVEAIYLVITLNRASATLPRLVFGPQNIVCSHLNHQLYISPAS